MWKAGLLLLALQQASLVNVISAAGTGFIRATNGHFVDEDCKDFVATGLNTWQLMEVAAGQVPSQPVKSGNGFADVVQWTLATAASNHLTVLRSFGHGVDSSFPLQEKPGKYNERAFKALDYILDEASKVGVRLILTMTDNWSPADSKTQYVKWSSTARGSALNVLSSGIFGEAGQPDAFFTDELCRQMFKDHMSVMANRRNTLNGRLYKDDPTIFAWDLINEPRCDCFPDKIPAPPELVSCRPECAEKMQRWIGEMSLYLKGADGNHMITIGEEGFYGPGSAAEVVNPGTGWATITGQNFSANHAPDSIDFAAIHLWPDNWEIWDLDFLDQWIRQHVADAKALGKPLLIEEFGKQVHIEQDRKTATITSVRAPFYRRVYSTLMTSLEESDALRGVIFWQFGFEPYVSNNIFGKCRHCEAIQMSTADSVFQNVVAPAAQKASKLSRSSGKVSKCTPASSEKRAAQIPHPMERSSEHSTISATTLMENAQSSQASLGQQMRLGVLPGRRSADSNPGRMEQRAQKRRPRRNAHSGGP